MMIPKNYPPMPSYVTAPSSEIYLSGADSITTGTFNPIRYRNRGFEFISINQFVKDFESLTKANIEVQIILPKRATKKSAGYDIFAPFDFKLEPNDEIKIPTGIRAYMREDEVLMIYPRSGLGFKYYCRLSNSTGIIDSDYYDSDNEGHIFVKLRNEGEKIMEIKKGQGICQAIFQKYLLSDGDDFTQGEDRNGGMGSTTK